MNEIITKENIKIENLVYEVRGVGVMLDSDLARLYECKNGTKEINQAVKNNIEKFPERFSFKLNENEVESFLVKNFDQKIETRGGRYKSPRVFTEQGVAMLATVLKSKTSTMVSIKIMDAFVMMRKYIASNNYEKRISNLETKYIEHDNKFDEVFSKLDKTVNNHIFFEGQIYDSFSLLLDIFESSKKNIIIIDNYADKKLLDILSKTKKEVTVYSKNYNKELIEKYKKQYNNVVFKENNSFHDRFIIIDKITLYHCGSSFKDLGNKCFGINRIEDSEYLNIILKKLDFL